MSYAVCVTFRLHDGRDAAFLPLMIENARASLALEPGCRRFDVCRDPNTPGEVFLYEIYDDRAAFDAHLDAPHFRDFDARTAAMVAEKTVRTWSQVAS